MLSEELLIFECVVRCCYIWLLGTNSCLITWSMVIFPSNMKISISRACVLAHNVMYFRIFDDHIEMFQNSSIFFRKEIFFHSNNDDILDH